LQETRNYLTKEFKQTKDPQIIAQVKGIKEQIKEIKEQIKTAKLQQLWTPNTPHPTTPIGKDANDNQIIAEYTFPTTETKPYQDYNLIDFERGAKLHGTRGYILKPELQRLKRKLINYALDHYTEKGFEEMGLPYLVNQEIAIATGHAPKFTNEMFTTQDGQFLIPTAEMPLTGMHKDENLTEAKYYVAHTPCFRREKIAYGKDNKGLKRVHQFDKIELYIIAELDQADQEHEKLLQTILDLIKDLKLTHRVIELCTGDLGFAAAKTYDIEVWMPHQQEWMEIASISNCTDFQAKRANIKLNGKAPATLNGTGLALERILIALLENNQDMKQIYQLLN
jgi:seryl-tRNA synthetase